MPTHPHTPHRLTATALVLVLFMLLTLTGCKDGQGVRDEGPATHKAAAASLAENQKAARH